jgi:CheY-like chemotaxis protein
VEFFRNAQGAKISWNVQLEKSPFGVRYDEAKVQQALTKILENAVEAVGDGRKGEITVQTRNVELIEPTQDRNVRLVAGTYVCVEITDNGSGIEPDVLPRIFEPFFTTKKSHRGLGLALVYGIVTNHGGGVVISSQPGAGTSARVYLPAEKDFIHESTGVEANLHGTETVLVVDDENLLLTMAETILTEYGYKVLTANSGQKALAILSRDDINADLVVTDLVMPGMGGRELIERIRQLAPTMRILCTSGYVMPADKQTGAAYLQKPFTSAELLAKVKHVLASKPPVD